MLPVKNKVCFYNLNFCLCICINCLFYIKGTLLADKWSRTLIQLHWNSEVFGGIYVLLNLHQANAVSNQFQFSKDLNIPNNVLSIVKNSCITHCIERSLNYISNSSSCADITGATIDVIG